MSARRLHDHLTAQDSLANLASHVRQIARVQRAYEKFLPSELKQISRVLNVKQGVVVVSASSGAVAHRLKQLLPSARLALQESCGEVTEVRVKVQAFDPPRITTPVAPRAVSESARRELLSGAAALDPSSALRRALELLVARAKPKG
jgi:hypothetical protein